MTSRGGSRARSTASDNDSSAPCDISEDFSNLSTKPSDSPQKTNRGDPSKPEAVESISKTTTKSSSGTAAETLSSSCKPLAEGAAKSLKDMTVSESFKVNTKQADDTNKPFTVDCCFMPGGELVLSDSENKKIKVLDKAFNIRESLKLPSPPIGIDVVDERNILATMPSHKQLQFIQVLPAITKGRTISVGHACQSVAVANSQIYVSGASFIVGVGQVSVYDFQGNLKARLNEVKNGPRLFRAPDYIATNKSGDKIFVSDYGTQTVSCLTYDGKIVWKCKDETVRGLGGIHVDDDFNVIVCCYRNHDVRVVKAEGNKSKTRVLVSENDGSSFPVSVAFRPNDSTLVIGCTDHVLVCKMA